MPPPLGMASSLGLALGTSGGGGGGASGYALDGSHNIDTDPVAHFAASDMNGNGDDNAGWTDTDAVGVTGGSDTVWKDRTGNYSAGYITTSTQRPLYDTGGTDFKSVKFDGSNDHLLFRVADGSGSTVNITLPTGAWHVFYVFEPTSLSAWKRLSSGASHYVSLYANYYIKTNTDTEGVENFVIEVADRNDQLNTSNWFEVRSYDTNQAQGRYQIKQGSDPVKVCAPDPGDAGELVLNALAQSSLGFAGYLHEVVFFGESLSTDDRATVVSYIQSKYSFAV